MFLSKKDFTQIVKNTPLISIDLCILRERKILLGKRINQPARNFFFVPGGRILKGEKKKDALERILKNELGLKLKNNNYCLIKDLGSYEHFYNENFLNNNDFNTHYLVLAFLIKYDSTIKISEEIISQQHSEYKWIDIDNIESCPYPIHFNTLAYFKNPNLKNI